MQRFLLSFLFCFILLSSLTAAQTVPMVKEEFRCLFAGAFTEETCTSARGDTCSGIRECSVSIKGPYGDRLKWLSTCGNEAMTITTGLHQMKDHGAFIYFKCKPQEKTRCNFDSVCQDDETSHCFDCTSYAQESCNYDLECGYGEREEFCQDCRDLSHVYYSVPPPLVEDTVESGQVMDEVETFAALADGSFEEQKVVADDVIGDILEEPLEDEIVKDILVDEVQEEEPIIVSDEKVSVALEQSHDVIPEEIKGKVAFNRFLKWIKSLFTFT